jgi:IS30 family transposase
MAQHQNFSLATKLDVFFAHSHSPWERSTNENANRLLREYFPKGTEITADPAYLNAVAAELNSRPPPYPGLPHTSRSLHRAPDQLN